MGWLYTIVRTFPFWAIPVGLTFIFSSLRTKPNSKAGKLWKMVYVVIGILLLSLSGAYLAFQGHKEAVPFFHELLNQEKFIDE